MQFLHLLCVPIEEILMFHLILTFIGHQNIALLQIFDKNSKRENRTKLKFYLHTIQIFVINTTPIMKSYTVQLFRGIWLNEMPLIKSSFFLKS